jgi:DNA end-binding protein Ku
MRRYRMPRAVWSGVISFGLVSVPVGMYSATEEHQPRFNQFEAGTNDRIRYRRVNERTGDEVAYSDIAKGADIGGGKYVMVTDADLDSIAPGRSRSLDISSFVDADDINPLYFAKPYYLAPSNEDTKKTYALLRDAMAKQNKAGIASFVMHGKEHLAAIRADGNVLVLETLYFADELRDPKQELTNLPGKVSFGGQELKMATQLIDSMSGRWRPGDYRDTYTDRVNKLIDSKRKNEEFEASPEAPEPTNVVDLMEALRRSVDEAKGKRGSGTPPKTTAKKATKRSSGNKPAAKRSTAKKSAARKAS